eukprot:scpid86354/ scgid2686/ MIT domain-containing protein 1
MFQITNFLRFCELLVRFGTVTTIRLQTGVDDRGDGQQQQHLQALVKDLATHHITLHITYSDTLHDREIRFDNGWVVKIGRGLDYFKAPKGRFSVGFCDMNLRACHATTIDFYFRPK